MNRLSNLISYLFHPLLMVSYGAILLFWGNNNTIYSTFTQETIKVVITLVLFSFTCVLPIINLFIFYKLRYISSLQLENRQERSFPYIATSLFYFGLFYMLFDFNIWPTIKLLVLSAGISILMVAIINYKWKISAHMTGIGGLLGAMIAISIFIHTSLLPIICLILVVSGLIGMARLHLKAHTPAQIYVGFILGCGLQLSLFYVAQTFKFV